jgi:tRNA (guanine-N7-)-methyltransferase
MITPNDLLLHRAQRLLLLKKTIHSLPNINCDSSELLNLEIGCGHGHWLTSFAEIAKERKFIGIDLITKRIAKANQKVSKRLLKNISFLKAEATEFLTALPLNILLQDCFVMYPDPWPKNRHHKRRLINQSFLDLLAENCTNTSKLYFMTDHLDYFRWSKQTISNSKHWNITTGQWPHVETSYFQNLLPKNTFLVADRLY